MAIAPIKIKPLKIGIVLLLAVQLLQANNITMLLNALEKGPKASLTV